MYFADAQKSLNISYQTKEFKDTCTNWQNYDVEQNSLNIVHTRKQVPPSKNDVFCNVYLLLISYDLPADVFGPSEPRPKPKKKGATKKRSHETSDGGVRCP